MHFSLILLKYKFPKNFTKFIFNYEFVGYKSLSFSHRGLPSPRYLSQTQPHFKEKISLEAQLDIHSYFNKKEKNKETFIEAIHNYRERERLLRGHVEFIYSCLKYMDQYGVQKDLEVYKAILDIFPKGKMIPNKYQVMFSHYPKHQECAVDVLAKMDVNGVIPDNEIRQILFNTFGLRGHPTLKMARMLYWMPKIKNASPWPLPEPLPDSSLELAQLALAQINSVDSASDITVMATKDLEEAKEDTWVVSAISPEQRNLLSRHDRSRPLKVEGPFGLYMRTERIIYFVLRDDPLPIPERPKPSQVDDVRSIFVWMAEEGAKEDRDLINKPCVHQQEDSTILATCATGTSSLSSVLSWIRLVERSVPELRGIPILFPQSSPIGEVITSTESHQPPVPSENSPPS